MPNTTVWTNGSSVQLAQLSDDPADGTVQEQIDYLATLAPYKGFTCVSQNYTGPVPDTDSSLWRWNGTEITAIDLVPVSITPRQVRLLLLQQGKLGEVEGLIAQQDEATRITWEYAVQFNRNDPLLNSLAINLGLTSEQVDQFFIQAGRL